MKHRLKQAIEFQQEVKRLPGNNIYMVSIRERHAVP
jgi:hypothetical protein